MTRKPFTPVHGEIYRNHGGGLFRCVDYFPDIANTIMMKLKSGWTFQAHGIGIYEDGSIDWDYSTDGTFNRILLEVYK